MFRLLRSCIPNKARINTTSAVTKSDEVIKPTETTIQPTVSSVEPIQSDDKTCIICYENQVVKNVRCCNKPICQSCIDKTIQQTYHQRNGTLIPTKCAHCRHEYSAVETKTGRHIGFHLNVSRPIGNAIIPRPTSDEPDMTEINNTHHIIIGFSGDPLIVHLLLWNENCITSALRYAEERLRMAPQRGCVRITVIPNTNTHEVISEEARRRLNIAYYHYR